MRASWGRPQKSIPWQLPSPPMTDTARNPPCQNWADAGCPEDSGVPPFQSPISPSGSYPEDQGCPLVSPCTQNLGGMGLGFLGDATSPRSSWHSCRAGCWALHVLAHFSLTGQQRAPDPCCGCRACRELGRQGWQQAGLALSSGATGREAGGRQVEGRQGAPSCPLTPRSSHAAQSAGHSQCLMSPG